MGWWLQVNRFAPILACLLACALDVRAEEPVVRFVSVPDFINMDLQFDDPRLFNLTSARQAQLVAEINSQGPQSTINPNVGNFVGTVENGYYGASQVLLEAIASENADFFTVSGDMLYTRWPKGSQLGGPLVEDQNHIRTQADIYYDGWIDSVETYTNFGLGDIYTVVGDHEVGDNNWGASKRPLIPTYKEVYVDKLGNPAFVATGAYVSPPMGFEGRTYAVQRGNLLLIGLDQFETFDSSGQFTQTANEIASVRIDVTGEQLAWLDGTLSLAGSDPTIHHVVVLGHAPIAAPNAVKVGHSSGLMNLTDENGALWQTLAAHGVDLYLPGEVHDISMQLVDDVLQVVTGTNIFQPSDQPGATNIGFNLNTPKTSEQNYLLVDVFENRIELTLKQIETKIWGNRGANFDPLNDDPYKNREARVEMATAEAGFQVVGTLTIDKSSGSPLYRNRTGYFLSDWTHGAPTNIDLNGDGHVNSLDALRFVQYFQTSFNGLSALEAFSRGDLNGDFLSTHADFRAFKVAYNEQFGEGALEAAFAVPEPACWGLIGLVSLWLRRRRICPSRLVVLAAVLCTVRPAPAAEVTGWSAVHPSTGAASSKPLFNADTSSPVLGNGTDNSAAIVALFADIQGEVDNTPDVELANGEQVTLSGLASLEGIVSSMEQFRFGMFYESSGPLDVFNWRGFIASNSAGSSGGALRAKFEDGTTFAQTGSATNLQVARDGNSFVDGGYHFSMTVSRYDDDAVINASLSAAHGWSQQWSDVRIASAAPDTFRFNRVGFLAGGGMHADRIRFDQIRVAVEPIDTLTLEITAAGAHAGSVQIVNERSIAFDIEYYEIISQSGSLRPNGWNSLDAQEADEALMGWDEAAGQSEKLLSEFRLTSTLRISPQTTLSLGKAVDASGQRDLAFYVGLADGSLVRGIVRYVDEGLSGDFNDDGIVDAADYVVWRRSTGSFRDLANDPLGGRIGTAQYTLWRSHYAGGAGSGNAPQAAPEAATIGLALIAVGWVPLRRARTRDPLHARNFHHGCPASC